MLSQQEILDLQAECFADDIPIPPSAASWGEERLRAYFESGGAEESVCGELDIVGINEEELACCQDGGVN